MKLEWLKVRWSAINDGAWIDVPGYPGLRLKVRGKDSTAYQEDLHKLQSMKAWGRMPLAQRKQATAELLVKDILLDWDGLEEEDGKPIPYSQSLAHLLVTDAANELLRQAVDLAAALVDATPWPDDAAEEPGAKAAAA